MPSEDEPRIRDLYASRQAPWIRDGERILVAMSKDHHPIIARLARLARSPDAVTVVLEKEGARAWELADGTRPLAAIAEAVSDPAVAAAATADDAGAIEVEHERLRRFTTILVKQGLLSLFRSPSPTPVPDPGFPASFREVACPRCQKGTWLSGPKGLRFVCPACRKVARERGPR